MKKKLILFAVFTSLINLAIAQVPNFAWAKQTGSSSSYADVGNIGGIAVDTINHFVYVTGEFDGGGIDFGTGTQDGGSGTKCVFLAKYTLNGSLVWGKSFLSNYDCTATGIAVDHSGNLFVTGYSESDTVRFGAHYLYNVHPNSTDNTVAFLGKFDANGNCTWLKGTANEGGAEASSVALDTNGNPYITGFGVAGGCTFDGHNVNGGAFFMKFDTNGNTQWFNQGGPNEILVTRGNAISIDHSGNCVVAGTYVDSVYFGTYGVSYSSGSGLYQRLIVKLNGTTGAFMWAEGFGIWEGPDYNYGVATDASDNIYLTGYTAIATEGPGSSSYTSGQFLEKLNSAGTSQWINTYSNHFYTITAPITVDAAGNTYVAYAIADTIAYGAFTISPNLPFGIIGASTAIAVVKTNSAGFVVYAKATAITSGSFTITEATGIALDGSENVYFASSLQGGEDCDATHLDAGSGSELAVAKLGTASVAGVNELSKVNTIYSVYPNPANDHIYIDNITEKTTLRIFDLSGKEAMAAQQLTSSQNIDLSGLQNGIYFIEFSTNASHVTQKLIIAK